MDKFSVQLPVLYKERMEEFADKMSASLNRKITLSELTSIAVSGYLNLPGLYKRYLEIRKQEKENKKKLKRARKYFANRARERRKSQKKRKYTISDKIICKDMADNSPMSVFFKYAEQVAKDLDNKQKQWELFDKRVAKDSYYMQKKEEWENRTTMNKDIEL